MVADAGALDAAAGASKSKRISKAEERERKKYISLSRKPYRHFNCHLKLLDSGQKNFEGTPAFPAEVRLFEGFVVTASPFAEWAQLQLTLYLQQEYTVFSN